MGIITYRVAKGITRNHAKNLGRALGAPARSSRWKFAVAAISVLSVAVGAFAQPIVFNEVMADNKTAYEFKGLFPDWVEFYNTSPANDVILDGWSLTDDAAVPRKYIFPNGTKINHQGYLVVRCAIPLVSEPSDLFTG